MARHPTAGRIRRKKTEPDDIVVAKVFEWSEWARRNARIVIIALAVLAVASLGAWYLWLRSTQLDQRAAARLTEVRQTAASGNVPLAVRDLQQFIQRFGGTHSGTAARLLLGQLQLEQDKPRDAVQTLTGFSAADPMLNASRLLLLGAAYEQAGDTARAVETYESVGNSDVFAYQRREALENAARLQMQAGKPAAAGRIYGQLVQMADDEPSRQSVYLMREAEADAAAGAAAPAPPQKDSAGA